MSRSGYSDDCDSNYLYLYRGMIDKTIKGKRSQIFLKELAIALEAMTEKRLIRSELISSAGEVCAIGAVCKARGLDISDVDIYEPEDVGALVDIPKSIAAEIEYENDENGHYAETPEERWTRIRNWVERQIK